METEKHKCKDCNATYYMSGYMDNSSGVRFEPHRPENGFCDNCGSSHIVPVAQCEENAQEWRLASGEYKIRKNVLDFYNHLGLLVEFDIKTGYDDYEKIKRAIQYNIKH